MKSALDIGCLEDTARLLFEFYGDRAPVLAVKAAIDLRRDGREDVAREWDMVSKKAFEMAELSSLSEAGLAN
jgi:hypothetical protein